MYSEKIIIHNLEEFARLNKWMPTYHTQGQCEEFSKYIDSILDVDSNSKSSILTLKVKLSAARQQEITKWIRNEQVLCALDSSYWESRFAYITDEAGHVRKFKNRKAQEVLDSVFADAEERQAPIQVLCLKGRQVGATSKVALKFIHRMMYVPNTHALMASVQQDKSDDIERKLDTAYFRTPFWLRPNKLPKRTFDNGSYLSIESGMQPKGIGQGKTITCCHICLAPDTLIHTQDGVIKRIADVVEGDLVKTSRHRVVPVRACVKSDRKDEVGCELSLWGNYSPLTVTRDHPILTPDGFRHAETINKHDYVVMPLRPITHTITTTELDNIELGRVPRGHIRKKYNVSLTYEWGWLCGLYLAEGCCKKIERKTETAWTEVDFTIHQDEAEEFKQRMQTALGMFERVTLSKSKRSQAAHLHLYNGSISRWLVSNFGHLADGKRIPDWIFCAGKEFIHGLIKGYCEGDGHLSAKSSQIVVSSISQPLIFQLRELLATCGFGWSCIYHDHGGFRYGRNCRDRWQMAINGDYGKELRSAMGWPQQTKAPSAHHSSVSTPKHWKYSDDRKSVWIEVFENRAKESAEFYDLEVDAQEHDFCTIHCCVKNSEIGIIPNPKNVIEEGLLPAVHPTRNLFMVFEGTGSGNVGWFPDFWRDSKKNWPLGLARMRAIFIPWPMATDLYPEADWLREHPLPESFLSNRMDATIKHVTRCESYIRNTPYLSRVSGKDYKMPLEQQWYWEFEYRQAKEKHTLAQFAARMPADDFEALTGIHASVFDPETIAEIEDSIYEIQGAEKTRKIPIQSYAVIGHDIDDEFYPREDQIDETKQNIQIVKNSHRGKIYEWTLVPLKPMDENTEVNTMDRLMVYELPQKRSTYACGIDTANGLGKEDEDRSVISMTKTGYQGNTDLQVAEYCLASGSIVITKDGVKNIEYVKKGDTVINRIGEYGTVSATNTITKAESLYVYTGLSTNEPLNITPDHKIATSRGWIEARDVKLGDWIVYPVRPLEDKNLPNVVIHGYKQIYNSTPEQRKHRDIVIPLGRDFGFTCGLYLAEGSIGVDRINHFRHVAWTLHQREAAPWKEIIQRAIPNVHITECQIKGTRAHRLIISSIKFANWFTEQFGRRNDKHIPEWVRNAPREFIEGLAHGMVAGDGGIDHRCRSVVYASVLPSLAVGLRDLVLSLGWGLGIIRRYKRQPIAQDAWMVYFYGETADRFMIEDMIRYLPCQSKKRRKGAFVWGWDKRWIYVKVKKITKGNGGVFHDITVEGSDPSFCVMQAAVHNCSNRLNSAQIVAFAAAIGEWYGAESGNPMGVRFAIEQVFGPGDTCQHQLKMLGFFNHHNPRRYDGKKIKDEQKSRQGFYSNAYTVPILMDRFRDAVNGGWYVPQSRYLIEELRTLEMHAKGGKSKSEHREGEHDDRVRAAAQSYFTMHDLDILTERAQARKAPPKKQKERVRGAGTANQMSVGDGW